MKGYICDLLKFPIPKCRISETKRRKSTFVDRNQVYKIKRNLGDFNYNALQKAKETSSKN